MSIPNLDQEGIALFWSHVNKSRGPRGCWLWHNHAGQYGSFSYKKQFIGSAHRIAYQLTHGPIPSGLCVCHTCDVPSCCNPLHLFLGTHRENMQDRQNKLAQGKRRKMYFWADRVIVDQDEAQISE